MSQKKLIQVCQGLQCDTNSFEDLVILNKKQIA